MADVDAIISSKRADQFLTRDVVILRDAYLLLQTQLAAANARADALQRTINEARSQSPAATIVEIDDGLGTTFLEFNEPRGPAGTNYYAAPVPAQPVAPVAQVPEGVVLAFGLLWHVRMGCDFHVPAGFSMNISPEEAAAKARRFLSDLLTREQRGDGINRAADMLAAATTAASHSHDEAIAAQEKAK